MKLYGASVVKGLLYTLKTFVNTYVEDFKRLSGKATSFEGSRTLYDEKGVCTVMYPEQPMPVGSTYERFRVLPMLIYDEQPNGEKDVRCTSCGICAKVCPPQCIWIVQETDAAGKPVPKPQDFHIDTAVCMNCGLCTEFCPFDAIKMDHQFELTYTGDREGRYDSYLYGLDKLLQPTSYYAATHPQTNAAEEAARLAEAEAKKAKEEAKKVAAAAKAAAAAAAPEGEAPEKPVKKPMTDEEKAALKEAAQKKAAEMLAKKQAAAAETTGAESSPQATDSEEKPAKKIMTPEEKAALKEAAQKKAAEMLAKKQAAAASPEVPADPAGPDDKVEGAV